MDFLASVHNYDYLNLYRRHIRKQGNFIFSKNIHIFGGIAVGSSNLISRLSIEAKEQNYDRNNAKLSISIGPETIMVSDWAIPKSTPPIE